MALPAPAADRTCVVTGASSGIGADIARELAKRRLGVTLVARRQDRLRDLATQLAATYGVRAEVMAADLTDDASRAAIASQLDDRNLTVDVLVNNAGFSTSGPVYRSDRAREVAMIRTDIEAVVDLCSTFLPGMVDRARGAVLNVASTAAFQPLPGQAGYAAAKAFVLAYSQAARAELRGTGVTMTVLCPGPVQTGFVEASGMTEEEAAGTLPKVMWLSSEAVAKAAVEGLDHGRAVVIPGAANKASAVGGYLTPRRLLLPILARQHPSLRR